MLHERSLHALCLAVFALCAIAAPAAADERIFLLDGSNGYGVDSCLASGAPCGEHMASAWCRVHDYKRALDFGSVANDRLVPLPSGSLTAACVGPNCPKVVTITCSR